LACAVREYVPFKDLSALLRDEVEKGLTFLGFLIMENKIKPVTPSIIQKLHHASIRTIMVTGPYFLIRKIKKYASMISF
jgi:cation-transporting P-type ATPase 13A2